LNVELEYFREVLTNVAPRRTTKPGFDPRVFLARIGRGRKIVTVPKGGIIFSQGEACDAVFYIQTGRVKLTVVSKTGKEATIGILDTNDFFGEDSLVIQQVRMGTATALTNCSLMRIEKSAMLKALHSQHKFSYLFVEHLLAKNIRYREDLIDQLFNSSEKRLARILLLFAGFGKTAYRKKRKFPKLLKKL